MIRNQRRHALVAVLAVTFVAAALFFSSCAGSERPPMTEEVTFRSGAFTVVGDLRTPGGRGRFPVVVFVHGSDSVNRTGWGYYLPIMERMLKAGYATFAWDKPGTGESIGTLDNQHVIAQRAQILLDAIQVLQAHHEIDSRRIGLWGISQAGYVMPRALLESKDIAFMICVSCPGMSGNDQMAFQVTALALCAGVPPEAADEERRLLSELDTARTYDTYEEYLQYREVLANLAGLVSAPIEKWPVLSEQDWNENSVEPEDLWNPTEVLLNIDIPTLAIFGEKDRQIDPFQGAHAYGKAIEAMGNPMSRVEIFPSANHGIVTSPDGDPAEDLQRFDEYARTLGYKSTSDALLAILKDPYKPGIADAYPFAPGYLDTIQEWLTDLSQDR
jgi:uncharacterized protein